MASKKSTGFWVGIALIVFAVLRYISPGVITNVINQLTPLVMVGAGIYLLVKS